MDKRFITFLVLSAAVILAHVLLSQWLVRQEARRRQQAAQNQREKPPKKLEKKNKPAEVARAEKPAAEQPPLKPPVKVEQAPAEWVTLGSANPNRPYRILVTLTNRGAAVECVEFNSPRFHDLDRRYGYLGYLAISRDERGRGGRVNVVGSGTPAELAGLKPGDILVMVGGEPVTNDIELDVVLRRTKPGDALELSILRKDKPLTLSATVVRQPLAVIRPEGSDPLSFLFTLNQIDGQSIPEPKKDEEPLAELPGLDLRTGTWTVLPRKAGSDQVSFERVLPEYDLRIVKTFALAKVPAEEQTDENAPAYHLDLSVQIENQGSNARSVAYRLDGPTGLPTEGWWYAYSSKIGRDWSSPGLRDVAIGVIEKGSFSPKLINASQLGDNGATKLDPPLPLNYIGVDAQYFSALLIPDEELRESFTNIEALRVGPVPADKNEKKLVDTSCRLERKPVEIEPGGQALVDEYQVFVGPKRPKLLAHYGPRPFHLNELVYYGWFSPVSRFLLGILHFFYGVVHNYGLAIIMLTVLVRSCMFPLSRKQALGAQKMQELQPEMKKIREKYKNKMEQQQKAQMELFRKHNYHPLSGCLPALIQLPIFLGLYRSLAVDIELRQAPLLSDAIRWCSNLAAPDMLWDWSRYLPGFLVGATGWLGPYLNVLPLATIALFIWQQKMFLPPPADEQAAMQQKMMQYMMIVMGVMFFKVASGLCIYFIASSLWGIAERKILPKTMASSSGEASKLSLAAAPGGNGAAGRRRNRERK